MKSYTIIGIDVSKSELEFACHGRRRTKRFDNTPDGIAALIEQLRAYAPQCVAVEATGGYERPVVSALHDADMSVAVVNPKQVRHYAEALGVYAKTDPIDARIIARFAADIKPRCQEKPDKQRQKRIDLANRRRQLIKLRTMETNRLYQARDPQVAEGIQRVIDYLNQEIKQTEQLLEEATAEDEHACRMIERLQTVKGIGWVTAQTLVNEMPELGRCSRQKIASLAGLAPFNCDSGQRKGQRKICGGRAAVRQDLYMATLSARRFNTVIRKHFEHLIAKGKEFKVAMVACMRKMLTYLNKLAAEVENEMKTT